MYNYHTHTYRCGHAEGDISDYVNEASKAGVEKLGFTEHTPLPDGFGFDVRMDISEMNDYLTKIDKARLDYPNIKIYKGLECEYLDKYNNYFKEELLEKWKIEYLICGIHFFPVENEIMFAHRTKMGKKGLKAYTETLIKAIESGIFTFFAHPDLFGIFYNEWDSETKACSKEIFQAAEDCNAVLEINALGWSKEKINTINGTRCVYPLDDFWELASDYKISVVVNSDAHTPKGIVDGIKSGLEYAKKYNLNLKDLKIK
jgi:histidinol-phosphatase (PHP family)